MKIRMEKKEKCVNNSSIPTISFFEQVEPLDLLPLIDNIAHQVGGPKPGS
jgi:hypothetical protein